MKWMRHCIGNQHQAQNVSQSPGSPQEADHPPAAPAAPASAECSGPSGSCLELLSQRVWWWSTHCQPINGSTQCSCAE